MTIPQKGSRVVKVDGRQYRFIIKGRTDATDAPELAITVQEDANEPGRPMQFAWPSGHSVTPEDVRSAVRDSIQAGWNPSSKGGLFRLEGMRLNV